MQKSKDGKGWESQSILDCGDLLYLVKVILMMMMVKVTVMMRVDKPFAENNETEGVSNEAKDSNH